MKPTVKFHTVVIPPVVGGRAAVYLAEAHHTLGHLGPMNWVNTSQVQKVEENGDFETMNTQYVKV